FKLLEDLKEFNIFTTPILVGLSRKSMIYKTLGKSPEDSLVGSISLEAFALDRGADILRVHDVGATKELVDLYCVMKNNSEAI
ncbi:MAG: dihydropteroate synthase, partial [Muribaculaceae bacterium]|nr:dihydropteroate synthase [Muribaculaceae bacterium]